MKHRVSLYAILALAILIEPEVAFGHGDPAGAPFVSARWLQQRLKDPTLVIFHIGVKSEYDTAHIPRAQYLSLSEITIRTSEGLTTELPSVASLDSVFESKGVSDNSSVLIYFGNDWVTPTTRVYFTLDYLGFGNRTFILNGGLPAWRAQGLPTTAEVLKPRRGTFSPRPKSEFVVSREWVLSQSQKPSVSLVDTRNTTFYEGFDAGSASRAGHIPGAINIPFIDLIDSAGTLKSDKELERILQSAGIKRGNEIITYCHVGQQATLLYAVAKKLGYTTRLYDGSFQDWGMHDELPVVRPAASKLPKLISTQELAALLEKGNVSVIDLRSDLNAYLQGHLPQAVYLHYESLRATGEGIPADLLSGAAYATLFSRLGIRKDQPVVIYASGDANNFNATFLVWILTGFSHPSVYILDGGFNKWKSENRTVTMRYPTIQRTTFEPKSFFPAIAGLSFVRWVTENKGGVLVDARPVDQFEGRAGAQMRRGHIPGAINHFWQDDLLPTETGNVWKSVEELRASYANQGITPDKNIIVYCNTGTEASHLYFALHDLLGFPRVRVYVPSFTEWAAKEELPVETSLVPTSRK